MAEAIIGRIGKCGHCGRTELFGMDAACPSCKGDSRIEPGTDAAVQMMAKIRDDALAAPDPSSGPSTLALIVGACLWAIVYFALGSLSVGCVLGLVLGNSQLTPVIYSIALVFLIVAGAQRGVREVRAGHAEDLQLPPE